MGIWVKIVRCWCSNPTGENFLLLIYCSLRSNTKLTTLTTLCITGKLDSIGYIDLVAIVLDRVGLRVCWFDHFFDVWDVYDYTCELYLGLRRQVFRVDDLLFDHLHDLLYLGRRRQPHHHLATNQTRSLFVEHLQTVQSIRYTQQWNHQSFLWGHR